MISANWFLFIFSIQIGRAVEASLGYFILPLVSVLFGMLMFGERLSRSKWLAVGLAGIAVTVLTIGLQALPFISLTLAVTFGIYGVIKKNARSGPVVSVTAEVLLLAPFALIWLVGVHVWGWSGFVGRNLAAYGQELFDSLLLMASGPITAGPLILFSYASRSADLVTLGIIQYINPSLQFLVAILIFAEPFTRWHAIAFPMIWLALLIFSLTGLRQESAPRRPVTSA